MRATLALLLLSTTPLAAQTAPPVARAVPSTEVREGVVINDPYRWMETADGRDAMIAWVRAQSATTTARLGALPARAGLAQLLDAASRAGTTYRDIQEAGDTLFYQQQDPDDRVPKLMARDAAGKVRLVYDPAAEPANATGPAAINSYSVSPDGRLVALHVSHGGSEVGDVRFLDAATGRETLARVGPIWGQFRVAWLGGGRAAVTRLAVPPLRDLLQGMVAMVGTPGGTWTPILGPGVAGGPVVPSTMFPVVDQPPTSDWTSANLANAGADYRLFVARRGDVAAGRAAWRQVADAPDRVRGAALIGDTLFLMSYRDDPDGRVTRQPASGGAAEVVATPSGLVLTEIIGARDGLYVAAQRDGTARLLFLPEGRGPAREVALPFESAIAEVEPTGDGRALTLMLVGWTTAPRGYRVEGGRLSALGLDSASWPGAAALQVRREEAVSADGTRVPMAIIARPEAGPRPTMLWAYGSYGIPTVRPRYNPFLLAWSGRGHVLAFCGTRGGNERGRAWHEAGRERNKPNAHADYIACAERLVQLGVARPGGILGTGTSAGGLLVPLAVQQRPDLFGALLQRVAILNATRLEVAENGANQFPEMGDPRTPDGFRALAAQDAYLALDRSRGLPPTLVTVGLNDRRVAGWMAAKFVAKAQARFGPDRAQLRADAEAGHGVGSARDVQVAEFADVYAWAEQVLNAPAAPR